MTPAAALDALRAEAAGCRACDLWAGATQVVFGSGAVPAPMMLVGEQPGDVEDREGLPFVGPAGRVLDDALERAGIDRAAVFATNAVKHFKWEPRGKRRIHKTPDATERVACRQWLEREYTLVDPRLVVALGVTAATSVLGRTAKIKADRGAPRTGPEGRTVLVTVHPSAILRARDQRDEMMAGFVADLALARRLVDEA